MLQPIPDHLTIVFVPGVIHLRDDDGRRTGAIGRAMEVEIGTSTNVSV